MEPKKPVDKIAKGAEKIIEPGELRKQRITQGAAIFTGLVIAIILLFLLLKPISTSMVRVQCFQCHSELQTLLKKKEVHKPFKAGPCTDCHTAHGPNKIRSVFQNVSLILQIWRGKTIKGKTTTEALKSGDKPIKKSKLKNDGDKFCYSCHDDKEAKKWQKAKFQHPPFKKGNCLSCHEPHASKYAGIIRQETPKLCPSCHSLTKWVKRKNQHPPFEKRFCASCHSPHATDVYNHLRQEPKELCTSCHRNIARQFNLPFKMKPFEEGKCPKCHNPHASNYRKLWQKGPKAEDLCFSCHDGSGSKLNVKKYKSKPYQMKPFKEGKCLECHYPHGSPAPWLQRISAKEYKEGPYNFCLKCHKRYKEVFSFIEHSTQTNKDSPFQPKAGKGHCLNCHRPHGSDYFGLVYKEIISLCTTCHPEDVFRGWNRKVPKPHIAHPVGLNIKDPWRGNYLRCSSCHNPMGTGLPKLRRKKGDDLCLQCHNADDPTWVKGRNKNKRGKGYKGGN